MDYNSNYEGAQVEELLDKVAAPDIEMSDDSDNLVSNKVIKEYVDLHPRYEDVEDVVAPKSNITPKLARMRFIDKKIYVDCSESLGESKTVSLARLGRHFSWHKPKDGSETFKVEKHGWRIYNRYTVNPNSRGGSFLISLQLDFKTKARGYYRYQLMLETAEEGLMQATPQAIMGCFGVAGNKYACLKHGHKLAEIPSEKDNYASQTYAIVIDSAYLPFRLTAHWENDEGKVCYGGTPLSL